MTSDLEKVSHMLDKLLPLVSPRDSVVLIHIVDESAEDVIAGEVADIEQVLGAVVVVFADVVGYRWQMLRVAAVVVVIVVVCVVVGSL